jgi:hypothetical protein
MSAQPIAQGLQIIRQVIVRDVLEASAAQASDDRVRVRAMDLPRFKLLTRFNQLVPGGNHSDARRVRNQC